MSKKMRELRDMLCEELWKVTKKGEISTPAELEAIDKLTHSIKSIDTIVAMEEYDSDENDTGYSEHGSSYARGRGIYAKRDSMGRYSRDGYPRMSSYRYDGYSRDDGKDEMLMHLNDMMNSASDDRIRQMVIGWRNQIESM